MVEEEDVEVQMEAEEIQKEIKKLEGKIPFFVLKDLGDSLEGKSVTKEQFNQIVEATKERIDQSRIDKKIDGMTSQVTKLSDGIGAIEKRVTEKPGVPLNRIERLEEKVTNLSSILDSMISANTEIEKEINQRLEEIERKTTFEVSGERVEKVGREANKISVAIDGLSKDIGMLLLGGEKIGGIVNEFIK